MLTLSASIPSHAIIYRPKSEPARLLTTRDEVGAAVDLALRRYGPPDTYLLYDEILEATSEVLRAYTAEEILEAARRGERWPIELGLVCNEP